MNCKLKKIIKLSGNKASIYSVIIENGQKTLFEIFLEENIISFKSEIENILKRLEIIGKKTGARDHYFKLYEGKLADGVCALYDLPDKKLRLYCIRFGTQLLILGGGGQKKVKKLQDDEKLKKESYLLRKLSEELTKRIKDKDVRFSNEGKDFEGDMDFDL